MSVAATPPSHAPRPQRPATPSPAPSGSDKPAAPATKVDATPKPKPDAATAGSDEKTPRTDPAGSAAPRDAGRGSKALDSKDRGAADHGGTARGHANVGAVVETALSKVARAATKAAKDPETTELKREARQTRDGREWKLDAPLSDGRNAHYSNRPEEMREALHGDYNWLEGDLRLDDDGEPVLSHDEEDTDEGLALDQWLDIGAAGKRGMKVDVKEPEAIPKLLDALDASDVKQGRMMINVGDTAPEDVAAIRDRFPKAWIALSPELGDDGRYTSEGLDNAIAGADAAGGRMAFPIRWDLADDETIHRLKPHGKVSIWTSEDDGTPDDTVAEKRALQARGADGVIDLGAPSSTEQKVIQRLNHTWNSSTVRGVRDVASGGAELAAEGNDALSAVVPGGVIGLPLGPAGPAAGLTGEIASHVPVVGGLFD